MHALQYLLCLLCSTVSASNNHTFPKPVLDLISEYTYYMGWYTTNNHDGLWDDRRHDGHKLEEIRNKLYDMVVPGYMDNHSRWQMIHLMKAKAWQTHDLRGGWEYNAGNISTLKHYREQFRQSSFRPSLQMIRHIEGLAEAHVWRAVNIRAGNKDRKSIDDEWVRYHSDRLTAKHLEITKIEFEDDQGHWKDGPPDSQYLGTIRNAGGSAPLTQTYCITTSKLKNENWSKTLSLKLGFKWSFGFEMGPLKGGSEISFETSASSTWGGMTGTTNGVSCSTSCVAGPGETVRCKALWKTKQADIPYVITYRVDKTHEIKVKGKWEAVMSYEGYVEKEVVNDSAEPQSA